MLEPLALIYKLNNGLVTRTLDGLTDEDFWKEPAGGGNPIGWMLGHLTETRVAMLQLLGQPAATGWETAFSRGSHRADRLKYPDRPLLEAAWKATHAGMREGFAALTAARLSEKPNGPALPGVTTTAEQLAFFAFHESYHVGQLGYVRRQLGYSAVAG